MTPPAVRPHRTDCETAQGTTCRCRCRGSVHQQDVLLTALGTPPGANPVSRAGYLHALRRAYGDRFPDLFVNPGRNQMLRSGRDWQLTRAPSTRHLRSRQEQRIVDVTLHDCLAHVQAMPDVDKPGWRDLGEQLTLRGSWGALAAAMDRRVGKPNSTSGFAWAAGLAATDHVQATRAGDALHELMAGHPDSLYGAVRYPRASASRRIREIDDPRAAAHIAVFACRAYRGWGGLPGDLRFVTQLTVATVCADLWQQPVAVAYGLLPAVQYLRLQGCSFSLDARASAASPGTPVEDLITTHLLDPWRARGAL